MLPAKSVRIEILKIMQGETNVFMRIRQKTLYRLRLWPLYNNSSRA